MDAILLAALVALISSHSAIGYAGYVAGWAVRDADAKGESLAEIEDEIEHAEDVRNDYDENVAGVDTGDDADLGRMLHDSADAALGGSSVPA